MIKNRWAYFGPAFVAAVAYVDPGNVATNVTAGAEFGFTLVWVVVAANIVAMLVQYLSAKLGLVTGMSLAAHMSRRLSRRARIAYWLQAEAIAIATDLAEVVGGAIALYLLFDIPLVLGAVLTVGVSLVILLVGDGGRQRVFERTILGFLLLIAVGFLAGLLVAPPPVGAVVGGLVPGFAGRESVLLASGIVGATVMPHVIYLHSSLTSSPAERWGSNVGVTRLLAITRVDVFVALCCAGVLNLALLLVAATSLRSRTGTDTLTGVYDVVTSELGVGVATLFAVALLGSGLASTSVGSAAGAEIMGSLLHIDLSVVVRRLVSAVPAVVVLWAGVDPTRALVLSQVVLSLGIPFALVPLVRLTSRRSVLGEHVNRAGTIIAAWLVTVGVIALNLWLIALLLVE